MYHMIESFRVSGVPGNLFNKERPQIEENRINEIKLYEMYVYLEVTGLLHLHQTQEFKRSL